MKKTMIILAAVLFFAIIVLSHAQSRKHYDSSDIEITAEGIQPEGIALHFRTPMDDGHYCPGANYEIEGSKIHYQLVRCPSGREYEVDVVAEQDLNGNLMVTFPFPNGKWVKGNVVELIDVNGKGHGRLENMGTNDL